MLDVRCWMSVEEALRADVFSTNIQNPTSNIGSSLFLHLLHVRNVDRALPLGDSALDLLGRIRLGVPLHHHHVLDDDLSRAAVDFDHAPLLALVAAGDDFDY